MNGLKHIIKSIALTICFSQAWAQPATFKAKVSKNPVATGERMVIEFELGNAQGNGFQAPSLSDFKVLGGPNQSSSFQFINGRTSSSQSFSFVVMPYKEGEFTIGSASIVADGKKMTTDPITVKVTKGSSVPAPSSNSTPGGGDVAEPKADKASGNVFIKLFLDKTKVYKGEQITATYKIYTRASIVDNSLEEAPSFNGFWSKNIDLSQAPPLKPENVNGMTYYSAVIQKKVLFPQRTGKLKVDALKMQVVLRLKEQGNPYDVFDQFFGRYRDVKYDIASNELSVDVLPLPDQGKPASFNGAVGNFNFSVDVSKKKLKANDAINLKLRVSGQGNLHLVDLVKPVFPSDFETYDPKISDQTTLSSGWMDGKKEWDYLLIPRVGGNFNIGPFAFSYFDPQKKKYVEISKEAIELEVQRDSSQQVNSVFSPGVQQKDIKTMASDVQYIQTNASSWSRLGEYFVGSILYWLCVILILGAFIGFYFYQKHQIELQSDTIWLRQSKASKVAQQRLQKAQQAIQQPDLFYEELYKGFTGYLADKWNIDTSLLTKEHIAQKMQQAHYADQYIQQVMEHLNYLEMVRFSPLQNQSREALYQQTADCINTIEKHKPNKA